MFYRDYEGDPITNTTFAELLKPLLGDGATRRSPREYHGPRFEGRQLPLAVQLDAVSRRDQRIAEMNRPKPEPAWSPRSSRRSRMRCCPCRRLRLRKP